MQKIIIIDNYDSFTYNVFHYLSEVADPEHEILIFRNDQLSVAEIRSLNPTHLIISPGPCTPNEAGISLELVNTLGPKVPTLGICLGHQAIAQSFGSEVKRAKKAMHGKTSEIFHSNQSIFSNIPSPLTVTRYHSLSVVKESLPECIEVLAETAEEEIMALRHRDWPHIIGLQFHPESILTANGKDLLKNFLELRIKSS